MSKRRTADTPPKPVEEAQSASTEQTSLPQKGGSYVKDAKGELTRQAHTARPPTKEEADQAASEAASKEES